MSAREKETVIQKDYLTVTVSRKGFQREIQFQIEFRQDWSPTMIQNGKAKQNLTTERESKKLSEKQNLSPIKMGNQK